MWELAFKSGLAMPKYLNLIIRPYSYPELAGRWSRRIQSNGFAVSWVPSLLAEDWGTTVSKRGPSDGSLGLFHRQMPENSDWTHLGVEGKDKAPVSATAWLIPS